MAFLSILVADDDALTRMLVRDILEPRGFAVTETIDGRDVCRLCQTTPFDIVLLDVVMPEQDGIETLKLLRQCCPKVRVIVMSGAFEGMFLKMAKRLGADAILKKPFTARELLDAIS